MLIVYHHGFQFFLKKKKKSVTGRNWSNIESIKDYMQALLQVNRPKSRPFMPSSSLGTPIVCSKSSRILPSEFWTTRSLSRASRTIWVGNISATAPSLTGFLTRCLFSSTMGLARLQSWSSTLNLDKPSVRLIQGEHILHSYF